jgi:hypothetical protein
VQVSLGNADDAMNRSLIKAVRDHGVPVGESAELVVRTTDLADCDKAGAVIADFTANTPGDYTVEFDGPGGNGIILEIRAGIDARVVSGFLATNAGLQ